MKRFSFALVLLLLCVSCKKETVIISGNIPPNYDQVPTIKIQNYVNRLFIDLIGREPLDDEMNENVAALRLAKLSDASRIAIIYKLQTDTSFIAGDGSYKKAYSQYLYNLAKIRTIEGSSDGEINEALGPILFGIKIDSLEGNWEGYNKGKLEADKFKQILKIKDAFFNDEIYYDQMFQPLIYNAIYDKINMNSFNYVNATYDNLLWRYPTDAEFLKGYDVIEFNKPQELFGVLCTDKRGYSQAITNTPEFFEGMIIWVYKSLLARDPTSGETSFILKDYINTRDIKLIQTKVMVTDEYANF